MNRVLYQCGEGAHEQTHELTLTGSIHTDDEALIQCESAVQGLEDEQKSDGHIETEGIQRIDGGGMREREEQQRKSSSSLSAYVCQSELQR